MFAVLQIRPQETGFLKKMRERLHPAQTQAVQVAVKGGTPFFCVETSRRKGEIPWDEVAFCAGRCAGRMLTPAGVTPPDGCAVKPFHPRALTPLAVFNTACAVLARRNIRPSGECITLIDPKGLLAHRAGRLIPFAALVRVITDNTDAYEQAAERIMEDSGAALLIQDTLCGAQGSTIVIAPDGLTESFFPPNPCAVFTSRETSGGYVCVQVGRIDLPEPYGRLLPDGIDPDEFAGALYEECGLRSIGERCCTRLQLYGTTTNIGGAARMLSAMRQKEDGTER